MELPFMYKYKPKYFKEFNHKPPLTNYPRLSHLPFE